MNNVYFARIFDTDTEFDSYMIIASNKVMKNGFIKLIHTKLFANEQNINIEVETVGENQMKCGVYTKEGLRMFEDESELVLDLW